VYRANEEANTCTGLVQARFILRDKLMRRRVLQPMMGPATPVPIERSMKTSKTRQDSYESLTADCRRRAGPTRDSHCARKNAGKCCNSNENKKQYKKTKTHGVSNKNKPWSVFIQPAGGIWDRPAGCLLRLRTRTKNSQG